jgi:single-strand selective monofunctional uracil DNA glycosylase
MVVASLESIAAELSDRVRVLRFGAPVSHVYNPLEYARRLHSQYLRRYGNGPKDVLLLGMNPGPWGMAQTGVPFGEVAAVSNWLGIAGEVDQPSDEHPKRPVLGLACERSEVSGRRLWGWAAETFGSPARFFHTFFVGNYCPLQFLEAGGRNLTPDKLAAVERAPLYAACDRALRHTVELLEPRLVIGIGAFAERRARIALGDDAPRIGRILHPSPASPAANRGWAEAATEQLRELGVDVP